MMRLSAYVSLGKAKDIEEQLQLMLNMRLRKKEKASVAIQGFYYYVEAKNRRKANDMIKIVEENAPASAKELKMIASVLLRKEARYIKEFQAYYDGSQTDQQRGMFAYMLGLQYSYINENDKSLQYLREAKKLLKGTPYEEVIQELLKGKK